MKLHEQILQFLDESEIPYSHFVHDEVFTSEEAAAVRGTDLEAGAKAMVIKAKDDFYLFVLPGDKKLDWKKVKKILGVKKVRFATTDEAEKITGVKIGGIPPFGNLMSLKTYFDETILQREKVDFNIGLRTESAEMSSINLVKAVNPVVENFVCD